VHLRGAHRILRLTFQPSQMPLLPTGPQLTDLDLQSAAFLPPLLFAEETKSRLQLIVSQETRSQKWRHHEWRPESDASKNGFHPT
jgi:hypothetical protein